MNPTFASWNLTHFISSYSYNSFLTVLGLTSSLLLVIFLILKEVLRAYEGPRVNRWKRALHVVTLILSFCFGIIIITRLFFFLQ